MTRTPNLPLFNAAEEANEPRVQTVSEVNKQVKSLLEGRFALVWLKGEVSNFKAHTSGHHYFSLKDQNSQINAVMFRGYNRQLKFRPENGMEVLVRGRVSVYEPRGSYQIFCETMQPVGAGALQQAFEKLKLKLKNEGLFESARKKQIPELPAHVALVTSPTGAAVQDMLNVLGRRFKGIEITVVPCKVQGEGAAQTVIHALSQVEKLNQVRPVDVVICGRGGGSIEDLWAFNEEVLARKIADFQIPIISAVGHEIDFTIADFVADLRAPTPSAAAELVVQNAGELIDRIRSHERRLQNSFHAQVREKKNRVTFLERSLVDPQKYLQDLGLRCDDLVQRLEVSAQNYLSTRRMQTRLLHQKLQRPDQRLARERQRVDHLGEKSRSLLQNLLAKKKQNLGQLVAVMDSLSPLKVVERGYSIVSRDGKVVKSYKEVRAGDEIDIRLAEGRARAEIKESFKE